MIWTAGFVLVGLSRCFANLTAVLRDFAEKFNKSVKTQKLKT
ncbi:hypothetical protein [uncultured Campylobacter sp.]|nr:hypothetical protein [uncultured Campylobacter sp.]